MEKSKSTITKPKNYTMAWTPEGRMIELKDRSQWDMPDGSVKEMQKRIWNI
jgi:hypothetical protein